MPSPAEGASCAVHPDRAAAATCAQCGLPACSTCVLPTRPPICRACDERVRRVEAPDDLVPATVWANALSLWRRALVPLAVLAVPFSVARAAIATFARENGFSDLETMQVVGAFELFVGVVGTVASARLLVAAARGERPRLLAALGVGLRRWITAAGVGMVSGLLTAVGLVLFVVPGVVVALNFCLAMPLLAATRLDPARVLTRSKAMVFGDRRRLLPVFALVVPVLFAPALFASFLPKLADPTAALALEAAADLAAALADAFLIAVQVSCFHHLLRGAANGVRDVRESLV